MKDHRIVCVGEVMIELQDSINAEQHHQGIGGDTFNTAVYLARAGHRVDYLTKLGDDAVSTEIIASLQQEGIGTDLIERVAGRQPGRYRIHNDDSGERHFTYWRDGSPARELFDEPVSLADVDVFYFSGITLAVTRSGIANLLDLLAQLKNEECQIVFDPNYRAPLWLNRAEARQYCRSVLPYCDTVMPTLDDETALWGSRTIDACRAFYADYNVTELVIKAPHLTVHAFTPGQQCSRKASPATAIDTTGAGDAFNAAYLAARLNGRDLGEALEAGQALAARVVRHRGAVLPRTAD